MSDRVSAALLLLRLVPGLLVAAHGLQKTTYLLGGDGLDGGAEEFHRDGFRGGKLTAVLAGTSQTAGGLLLAAGLLTPLSVAAVAGVMTVAGSVKAKNGLWTQHDGYEYPLVLVVLAAVVGVAGPGRWAIDQLMPFTWPLAAGIAAPIVGITGALLTRAALREKAAP